MIKEKNKAMRDNLEDGEKEKDKMTKKKMDKRLKTLDERSSMVDNV